MKKSRLIEIIEMCLNEAINVNKLINDFNVFRTNYSKRKYNTVDTKITFADKYSTKIEKKFNSYNNEILDLAIDALFYDKELTVEKLEKLQQYVEKLHGWKSNKVNAALRKILDHARVMTRLDREEDAWKKKRGLA